jgi:hypothetical protein
MNELNKNKGSRADFAPKADIAAMVLRCAAILFSLILATAVLLCQCFSVRRIYFDEIVLHNPIYMDLHYGKISCPAQSSFDTLVIHPPTLYLLVANLMKTGLSLFHAAGTLYVILFVLLCALVISSRLPFPVQIACIFGGYLGPFVWNEALLLRPDLMLVLSWLIGLVALESARLDDWSRWRLAIGGFFIVLPAATHYVAVATCAAVPLFAFWIWKTSDRKHVLSRLYWLVGGAAAIGIPTLLFVFVPHSHQIVSFARSVNEHQPVGPYAHHMQAYALWHQAAEIAMRSRPLSTLLTQPLYRYLIPAGLAAPLLLALAPSTRGIALASLPHLLFLLFGARYTQVDYSGYYAPEISLYLIAVTSLVFSALFALVRLVRWRWLPVGFGVLASAGLAVATLKDVPSILGWRHHFTPGVYDLEIARAAGQNILGLDAAVGTTSPGVWFTGGAAVLYIFTPDITEAQSVECVDLRRYFSAFDAIVLDPVNSWLITRSM